MKDKEKRAKFEYRLINSLLELVNVGENDNEEEDIEKGRDLLGQIKYKQLYNELRQECVYHFSDFLRIEEDFNY